MMTGGERVVLDKNRVFEFIRSNQHIAQKIDDIIAVMCRSIETGSTSNVFDIDAITQFIMNAEQYNEPEIVTDIHDRLRNDYVTSTSEQENAPKKIKKPQEKFSQKKISHVS
jgi:hypothetical protein